MINKSASVRKYLYAFLCRSINPKHIMNKVTLHNPEKNEVKENVILMLLNFSQRVFEVFLILLNHPYY